MAFTCFTRFWYSSYHLPLSWTLRPAGSGSQLSLSWGKQWGSSLLSSTTGWSGRKSKQSKAAQSHSSSLKNEEETVQVRSTKDQIYKKKIKIFKNPNLLRVSEGLEDLSVQVVAAVDQIWVIVCQVGWRWRGWALPALKHAFQHRELHQV